MLAGLAYRQNRHIPSIRKKRSCDISSHRRNHHDGWPERRHLATTQEGLQKSVYRISGMDCGDCAAKLEKRLSALPGVKSAAVNFGAGKLTVEHNTTDSILIQTVKQAGYRATKRWSYSAAIAGNCLVEKCPYPGYACLRNNAGHCDHSRLVGDDRGYCYLAVCSHSHYRWVSYSKKWLVRPPFLIARHEFSDDCRHNWRSGHRRMERGCGGCFSVFFRQHLAGVHHG